jgi:hypothetical protein
VNERTAYFVLGVVLILVMGRTVLATQSSAPKTDGSANVAGRLTDPVLIRLATQDSLLRTPVANRRDPFRPWNPPVTATTGRPTAATPAPAPVVPPRVVVFMQDGNSVIVQFEVGGDTSPRLPVGGSFRGWTVVGVSGGNVTLSKDGQQFAVPRP